MTSNSKCIFWRLLDDSSTTIDDVTDYLGTRFSTRDDFIKLRKNFKSIIANILELWDTREVHLWWHIMIVLENMCTDANLANKLAEERRVRELLVEVLFYHNERFSSNALGCINLLIQRNVSQVQQRELLFESFLPPLWSLVKIYKQYPQETLFLRALVPLSFSLVVCTVEEARESGSLIGIGELAAKIIQATEFGVVDCMFKDEDTGIVPTPAVFEGQSMVWYGDLLVAASQKLRKNDPHDLNAAICMVNYLRGRGLLKESSDTARRALTHHPNVPFLYQAAAQPCSPAAECLSLAEKGLSVLKGREKANYVVRLRLLQAASMCCQDLAFQEIVSNMPTNAVVTHMESALSYAEEYVSTSPPDMWDRRRMIIAVIWMSLVLRPNSFYGNPEKLISWLEDMERQLQQADEVASVLYGEEGQPPVMHHKLAVVNLILRHKSSLVKWAKRFQYEWKRPEDNMYAKNIPTFVKDTVKDDLQFCSWCANPSVKLKKCSGCRIARYCNVSCLKNHWKQHKPECKPKA
ncbi:hypothetical protein HK102_009558 [Quaeritorhiza haematococci]|nr:hypothetical protein HK102_009558 [Quaeritorhiza haematococci]